MHEIDGERYYTLQQTASRLNISTASLRTYRSDGRDPLPSTHLLGRVFYPADAVEAYARRKGAT